MPERSPRVLFVEDDDDFAELITADLAREMVVERADSLRGALDVLASTPVSVVLIDLNLPDARGLDGLVQLRASYPALPILVLTALDDDRTANDALRAGAQDYLVKWQARGPAILRAVRFAVERADLVRESERAVEREAHQGELRTMGALVTSLVSELNNVHAVGLANVQLLRDRLPDESPLQHFGQEAEQAIRRAASFCFRLLFVLPDGEPRLAPLDLNDSMQRVWSLVSTMLPRGSRAELELDVGPLLVLGDAAHLEQAVVNLAVHAVEPEPLVAPALLRFQTSREAEWVRLEMTGLGDRDWLDRWEVADLDPRRAKQGIALAVTSRVVRAHGGRMQVDVGDGHVIVRIDLPAV